MYTILAYSCYLLLSVFTVFVVGRSLHREGKVYLFGECPDIGLSNSANNFLYICYCLLNSGFALFFLGTGRSLQSFTAALEFVAYSQGIILMSLGILHVVNVLFAPRIIRKFLDKKLLTK